MAQMISCQTLTTEIWLPSPASTCEIFSGRSGTGPGFSPITLVLPSQYHSTNAPHSSSSPCCPSQKGVWEKQGIIKTQCCFKNMRALDIKVLSLQAKERKHCILQKYSYVR